MTCGYTCSFVEKDYSSRVPEVLIRCAGVDLGEDRWCIHISSICPAVWPRSRDGVVEWMLIYERERLRRFYGQKLAETGLTPFIP